MVAEAVDDQAGQQIPFSVAEAVKGLVKKAGAQVQRRLQALPQQVGVQLRLR